ncbi:MAG: acyltransferase [Desulfosudaceae bacterium]
MLSFLPGPLRGVLSLIFYTFNTIFWCGPLFTVAIIKFLVPVEKFRLWCGKILIIISFAWVRCNNFNQNLFNKINFEIHGLEGLNKKDWYLVVSNHQSWADILVLQRVFYRKIPFLKFFLKKELIWVPVLGLAWWALDFPFMRRYSGAFLKKNPHLKGKDVEITRQACQKFSKMPVAVINFLEGTRFRPDKHLKQQSPYQYLLKPKAGGIAFVLAAMGEHLSSIINVRIFYPEGRPTFWGFLSGRVSQVIVQIDTIPITEQMIGDYFEDSAFRENFQVWVNELWQKNDEQMKLLNLKN